MKINIVVTDIVDNFEAIEISEKVLTIMLQSFLLMINSFIILSKLLVHRSEILNRSKYGIPLLLAVVGLLISLLTKVVDAVMVFQQHSERLSCTTVALALIYWSKFHPVLYGSGLVLLALDAVLRSRGPNRKSSVLSTCAHTLAPWIIALVVVCPLTLIKADWDASCEVMQTDNHIIAGIVVCGIFPVVILITYGLGVKFIAMINRRYALHEFEPARPQPLGEDTYQADPTVKGSARGLEDSQLTVTVLVVSVIIFTIVVIPYSPLNMYIVEDLESNKPVVHTVETPIYIIRQVFRLRNLLYAVVIPVLSLFV